VTVEALLAHCAFFPPTAQPAYVVHCPSP
jgi:hypothetical protein